MEDALVSTQAPEAPRASSGASGAKSAPELAALRLSDVSKVFSTRKGEIVALEDMTFEARSGEFLCIIGPSGCGKSTMLNLLAGLTQPTAGEITIGGRTPDEARKERLVGLVFQEGVLLPWRTVLENIELPLKILHWPKAKRREVAVDLARLVGLEEFHDAFPRELSGGMQQRVALARGLSHDPPLLLMDEPFGALDAITRDRMNLELLRIWTERPKTILFVTHSIGEAVLLADRIVVLSPRPGRVAGVFENPLPRPRSFEHRDEPEFAQLSRTLRHLLEV